MNKYVAILLLISCDSSVKPTVVEPEAEVTYDNDADGYADTEDCDDANSLVYPGAPEICDGVDNNCNEEVDEGVQQTFYADTDEDGFGDENNTQDSCEAGEGYVANGGDCNDENEDVYPFANELCDELDNNCNGEIDEGVGGAYFVDGDGDGFGDGEEVFLCNLQDGYAQISGDCNDSNTNVYPDAPEICDSLDNDCDEEIDEDGLTTFYLDEDEDGYGSPTISMLDCEPPAGYVANPDDCNDIDTFVSPDAQEICDNIDNNCDGLIDDADPTVIGQMVWFIDYDADGFGNQAFQESSCTQPSGYVSNSGDCNDLDENISPNGQEICDELDNNCDTQIDEGVTTTYYTDDDADGFGAAGPTIEACSVPTGYSETSGDCNDNTDAVFPGNPEICDNVDNNCNGQVDEGIFQDWFLDYDQDGYGDDNFVENNCEPPSNLYVGQGGDCNDLDSTYNPGASLDCTGEDYNCDGQIDNDLDLDGYPDEACGGDDCDDGDASIYPAQDNECTWGNSCREILDNGLSNGSGLYTIDVDGFAVGESFEYVYCDMDSYGGGWTMIANNSASDSTLVSSDMISDSTLGSAASGDHKAQAWNNLSFSDVMFTDGILFAVYENVGNGNTSWYSFQLNVPLFTCAATSPYIYPMTAGNFGGNLCSTNLYINAIDHDGGGPTSCNQNSIWADNSYGPTWSTLNNGTLCPLDDPGTNTFWYHDSRLPWSQTEDLMMFVR